MMIPVYVAADNVFSPVGNTTVANFEAAAQGLSAIREINETSVLSEPFYASMFPQPFCAPLQDNYTRFEKICMASIADALAKTEIKISNPETVFILSTTKGNIDLIENHRVDENIRKRVSLFNTANVISLYFGSANRPVVISHACISGSLSILVARRLLQSGKFSHAVITGADVLSKFIVSGFRALGAMSGSPCKPFDQSRQGITLGECAATIILTTNSSLVNANKKIVVNGGASTNDANHISGPSRTGLELAHAIKSAMLESDVTASDLSFISAHGTATLFNDEMESKAFSNASLAEVPVHSLKGIFGHTLGAAGVVESALSCQSLREKIILPSKNFEVLGVSAKINVSREMKKSEKKHALKTASGFGGSNAAIIYSVQ